MAALHKLFYPKLAVTNLKKNRSTYFPYMLTCVVSIATFYTMYSIADNPGLADMPGTEVLTSILWLGTIIIALFSAALLFYTNSFLIKRRKKELGLYSILGMEKRHIVKTLFFETLFISVLCIALGLLVGALISKLLFLILLYLLNLATPIVFTLSWGGMGVTAILFACIFLLTLLTNFWQIHIANPIALLKGGQTGEKEPKSSWLLTLIGLLALGGGYAIALTVQSPLDALLLFFLAALLVIIGTFALFTSGSIALLKLLRRNKRFYYRPKNFISVSGMIYRMKQNAVGLANICILSTMVLVVISTTVSLYLGQERMLDERFPMDVTVQCADNQEQIDAVHLAIRTQQETSGVQVTECYDYRCFQYTGFSQQNMILSEVPSDFQGNATNYISTVTLIPLSDYNRMEGKDVTLGKDEALIFTRAGRFGSQTLWIDEREFSVKEELDSFVLREKVDQVSQNSFFVILADMDVINDILASYPQEETPAAIDHVTTFNIAGSDEAVAAFSADLRQACRTAIPGVWVDSRELSREDWYSTFGGFLFLGLFLGMLFMMAMVLIIYYKQISEGYDDHDRFTIMQKVGMSKQEVKKTIHKQILMVFFLPLLLACVHITVAFPVISKLLLIFNMTDTTLNLVCTMLTVLFFAVVYAIVYSLTARTYYRIVQEK